MRLNDVVDLIDRLGFPCAGEDLHPGQETVRAARALVQDAVTDPVFLNDCLSADLALTQSHHLRSGITPHTVAPRTGIGMALGYWAPGATPGPHEHTAWTVSAVCHNQIEVQTYDRLQSQRRSELVEKDRFTATQGQVGFVSGPCIHAPINKTRSWSLTFHLVSPLDGEPVPDQKAIRGLSSNLAALNSGDLDPALRAILKEKQRMRYSAIMCQLLGEMKFDGFSVLNARAFGSSSKMMQRRLAETFPDCFGCLVEPNPDCELSVVHSNVVFKIRDDGAGKTLCVETARGDFDIISIQTSAVEVLKFVATHRDFRADELPDSLTWEENDFFMLALEASGAFKRRRYDAEDSANAQAR